MDYVPQNQKQTIKVTIDKATGLARAEAFGIVGTACSTELNWLGRLGNKSDENKPEYSQDNFINVQH